MLIHAIAHGGCTNIVRKSALEVDSGRKNLFRRRGDSNPHQYFHLVFQSDWPSAALSSLISVLAPSHQQVVAYLNT